MPPIVPLSACSGPDDVFWDEKHEFGFLDDEQVEDEVDDDGKTSVCGGGIIHLSKCGTHSVVAEPFIHLSKCGTHSVVAEPFIHLANINFTWLMHIYILNALFY